MSASNVTTLRLDEPIRILPHDTLVEQRLLAAIIYDNSVFAEVAGIVHQDDFFVPVHGRIFAVIGNEIGAGRDASAMMLRHVFLNDAALERLGGGQYISDLDDAVVTTHNAPDYAHIVADLAQKRAFIGAMQDGLDRAYADGSTETASELKAGVLARLDEISRFAPDRFPEPADLLGAETVPAFPITFLPGALGPFALDQAGVMQAPVDFIAIPLLIAAGTVIGKDFLMAPKALDGGWTERPCLWGGCVANVGMNKTASFNKALGPVWRLRARHAEAFREAQEAYEPKARLARMAMKQWEKDAKAAFKKGSTPPDPPEMPAAPMLREMVANDTTQERLVGMMQQNPRGIMLYRDELSAWFAQFNQYRPGGDEQFYLQCHSGGPWAHHRNTGDLYVEDLFLGVFGGFQPDVVKDVLGRRSRAGAAKPDNGMCARFSLLVWPDDPGGFQFVDRRLSRETTAKVDKLFRDLEALSAEAFVGPKQKDASHYDPFRFTPEGQAAWLDWYLPHQQALREMEPGDQLKGHFHKYDGLFARLAIVHHLIRRCLGEKVEPARVDDHTVVAVRDFIELYLRPHALKIYRRLGRSTAYHGAQKIAQWIVDSPQVVSFVARDISRKMWGGLTEQADVDAALAYLENVAAWVRTEDVPAGPRGGRPTKAYVINPKVRKPK